MSPLGLMPPATRRKLADLADKRIGNHEVHDVERWPNAELAPTLAGLVHGLVGRNPWVIQCDGCGRTEARVVLILCNTRFHINPETDSRRLCPDCQQRARWAA